MIPQFIYVALTLISLGMNISKHGEEKTGKNNAWSSFISVCLIYYILYKGGFFNGLI